MMMPASLTTMLSLCYVYAVSFTALFLLQTFAYINAYDRSNMVQACVVIIVISAHRVADKR